MTHRKGKCSSNSSSFLKSDGTWSQYWNHKSKGIYQPTGGTLHTKQTPCVGISFLSMEFPSGGKVLDVQCMSARVLATLTNWRDLFCSGQTGEHKWFLLNFISLEQNGAVNQMLQDVMELKNLPSSGFCILSKHLLRI